MNSQTLQYTHEYSLLILGVCYVYDHKRSENKTSYGFELTNSFFPNGIIPKYTSKRKWDNKKNRYVDDFPVNTLRRAMVLGNSMIFGKEDSVVVGLPYAWIGKSYSDAFSDTKGLGADYERRVGTIGRIGYDFTKRVKPQLTIPKPQSPNVVAGSLTGRGGAIWGSGESYLASQRDPIRNQYTGTSISKGTNFIQYV